MPTSQEERIVGHLGPDLCGPEQPDLDEVLERLTEAGDEPLAGALLDQRNAAGFGNVYAVELPFVVGVAPQQPVGSIDGLAGLLALGTAVIRTNAARGPQNTTGPQADDGRPLDLRQARAAVPAVRDDARRVGRAPQPVAPGHGVVPRLPAARRARDVDLVRARKLLALHPARREPSWPRAGD